MRNEMRDHVRNLLADHPQAVRDLALHARTMIADVVPDAIETVQAGWDQLSYGTTREITDQFVFIKPKNRTVVIGFPRGHSLADPDALLSNESSSPEDPVRQIVIESREQLDADALKRLVQSARAQAGDAANGS